MSFLVFRTSLQLIVGLTGLIFWLAGLVLAQGAWQTLFAYFPVYAWYLVVQRVMQANGWI